MANWPFIAPDTGSGFGASIGVILTTGLSPRAIATASPARAAAMSLESWVLARWTVKITALSQGIS
jgi:hypothetical protein